jgi:uncharacterized protein (DUF924 family)
MDKRQTEVLDFWFRELTMQQWFGGGPALDALIRERFDALHEEATQGRLDAWASTKLGRLALIIVLDQFSRNIHRGTARAFALDGKAQALAAEGIKAGMDETLTFAQRHFFYMPLMHAEDSTLQALSVERFTALSELANYILGFAKAHRDEFERFGRFPGRNKALGRADTAEEARYLAERK